jgi:hypothetical protein
VAVPPSRRVGHTREGPDNHAGAFGHGRRLSSLYRAGILNRAMLVPQILRGECPAGQRGQRPGFFASEKLLHGDPVITGLQIKLARLALKWPAQQLADRARLGIATISRAESSEHEVPRLTAANLFSIQRVLEAEGIVFVDDGEQSPRGGPGIRWRGGR